VEVLPAVLGSLSSSVVSRDLVDPGELFLCRSGTAFTAQLTAMTRPPLTTTGTQLPMFLL